MRFAVGKMLGCEWDTGRTYCFVWVAVRVFLCPTIQVLRMSLMDLKIGSRESSQIPI